MPGTCCSDVQGDIQGFQLPSQLRELERARRRMSAQQRPAVRRSSCAGFLGLSRAQSGGNAGHGSLHKESVHPCIRWAVPQHAEGASFLLWPSIACTGPGPGPEHPHLSGKTSAILLAAVVLASSMNSSTSRLASVCRLTQGEALGGVPGTQGSTNRTSQHGAGQGARHARMQGLSCTRHQVGCGQSCLDLGDKVHGVPSLIQGKGQLGVVKPQGSSLKARGPQGLGQGVEGQAVPLNLRNEGGSGEERSRIRSGN